ncbi:Beta-xylosidase [Flavobacterium sp. 9AF]|uniref:glycoside hydrolase family 43 protein n=1 Tax=Flavobacterium sp. 9AF TaxID=2653142 RepID=UPI0012F0B31F|nr:glycoside hydrolase 43 family protein [Flavobacterium sp. 9AF]VXC03532.1 Beta-xylosidase [Flavobacterium sp. 9AF]
MKHFCKIVFLISFICSGQQKNQNAIKNNNSTNAIYTNPILHSDYSDPDVIRVGEDYYMTASSFNCIPGLPILHSKDLVNWQLVNYALKKQPPFDVYKTVQHGNGVWAPCIRYHNKEYYIFYPDPEFGIYMVKTNDPLGVWTEPVLIKEGKGIIDPTPLWDEDGKVYLAYAFAGSRAGIKSLLAICTLNSKTLLANNDDIMLLDGHDEEPTIEGPKLYKYNNYYYIFAPAGGVATGWQTVLRSKNIFGPYEKKKVMEQGNTTVNGPHQGAWIQTEAGEDWFIHFQDKGAYGRIVHLQPMTWEKGWPIIGEDNNKDGIGQPVISHKKPKVSTQNNFIKSNGSDEFNEATLKLEWQWHANPEIYWGFPSTLGYYTMYCTPKPDHFINLYDASNLLLQKFPSETFTAITKVTFNARHDGEQIGFLIMGLDYSYLKIERNNGNLFLSQVMCFDSDKKKAETETDKIKLLNNTVYLQAEIKTGEKVFFSYSMNNEEYFPIGKEFVAREGKWIGAKIGYLALRNNFTNDAGSVAIDWFRIK